MLSSLRLKSIAVIIGLLIGPCLVARTLGTETNRAARLGLALVFGFTALGHFAKTDAMAEMLPPSMPKRRAVIWISGVFEAASPWPSSPAQSAPGSVKRSSDF